jgi:hypothetical protein
MPRLRHCFWLTLLLAGAAAGRGQDNPTTASGTVVNATSWSEAQQSGGATSGSLHWSDAQEIAAGGNITLCATNARPLLRDPRDMFHVIWAQNNQVCYARLPNGRDQWVVSKLPRYAKKGALAQPMLANAGYAVFAAWTEGRQLVLTRSDDFGDSWQKPIVVADQVATASISAALKADGSPALVVVWGDTGKSQVLYSTWGGHTWSAADFATPAPLSGNETAQRPTICSNGMIFFVAWGNAGASPAGLSLRRSTDYGQTWLPAAPATLLHDGKIQPLGGAAPALAASADGTLYLAAENNHLTSLYSAPGGGTVFTPMGVLGGGVNPFVSTSDAGDIAVAWEYYYGKDSAYSAKRVGLVLYTNHGMSYVGPAAMPAPNPDLLFAQVQPFVLLRGPRLEVVWVDRHASSALIYRCATLGDETGDTQTSPAPDANSAPAPAPAGPPGT